MDKVVVALIGAVFGFLGGLASEYLKRRISRLDAIEKQADELCGDIVEQVRTLGQGVKPERADIRAITKLRRQFGIDLSRRYARTANWPKLKAALDLLDHILEVLDEAHLSEDGATLPAPPNVDAACASMDSAVRSAAESDLLWKWWKAR